MNSEPLGNLAHVHYGKSPAGVMVESSGVPVYGTGGVYGKAARSLFDGPGVVVPRKGSLGNPQFVEFPFWASDTTFAVIPKAGVDARWLYYCLDAHDLTRLNEATGVPSISRDWLYRIRISAPAISEQRRIAEVLGGNDEAIERTEALIAKYQQIKAGLMHDLFTRGVTSDGRLRPPRSEAPQLYKHGPLGWIPANWDMERLGTYLAGIDSGWSPNCLHVPAAPGEWGVLKTTAVVWDGYTPSENKALPKEMTHLSGAEVKAGDILITRKGPVDRVGVVVFAGSTPPCLMFPDTVFRTTLSPGAPISGAFAARVLGSPSVQKHWWQRKVGLADAQVNLNHGILRETPIPFPGGDEQEAILGKIEAAERALEPWLLELPKLRQLKQGLMHDLLTGRVRVKIEELAAT